MNFLPKKRLLTQLIVLGIQGGQQGVNLACCHAYKENFKLQGAFPRIAAVLFFAEKNGWIDSKACIGFTKLLKDTGEILIKMDTEHR